jgi:Tol biopolymer transport system component
MRFVVALLTASVCLFAQSDKKPFDVDAMMRISRVSEPQLSPDGKLVAFTVERPDVAENKKPKQIYAVPIEGGTPVPLTTEGSNERPRWTRDSSRIVFISSRGGSPQVWSMKPDGSEQRRPSPLSRVKQAV